MSVTSVTSNVSYRAILSALETLPRVGRVCRRHAEGAAIHATSLWSRTLHRGFLLTNRFASRHSGGRSCLCPAEGDQAQSRRQRRASRLRDVHNLGGCRSAPVA